MHSIRKFKRLALVLFLPVSRTTDFSQQDWNLNKHVRTNGVMQCRITTVAPGNLDENYVYTNILNQIQTYSTTGS